MDRLHSFEKGKVIRIGHFQPEIKIAITGILKIVSLSHVKEDPLHALEMLYLAMKSRFGNDPAFVLACVAHDIERALPCHLRSDNFSDYDSFKKAHAQRSAEITEKFLKKYGILETIVSDATNYIRHHEFGLKGNQKIEELVYLDVLSFLHTNASFYASREPFEKLVFRIVWGLQRLTLANLERLKKEVTLTDEVVALAYQKALLKLHNHL
jgi:hypothetical protein